MDFRKKHCFLKVPRLLPFVLLRAASRGRWVWSTDRMISTGHKRSTVSTTVSATDLTRTDFGSYRTANTLHLRYKNQSLYALWGKGRCLFGDRYKTHKQMTGVDRTLNSWILNLIRRTATASCIRLLSKKNRRWPPSSSGRLYVWYPVHTTLDGPQPARASIVQPAARVMVHAHTFEIRKKK